MELHATGQQEIRQCLYFMASGLYWKAILIAHFHQIWAELAVLFSRQILNQSIEFKNSFCQGIR